MTNEEYISAIREIYHNNKTYDWSDDFLLKHGCMYLVSEPKQKQLQQSINKIVNSIRFTTCANVFRELERTPYAVIKGAVLAQHAYGSNSLRLSSDIDLLTSKTTFPQIKAALLSKGFIQGLIVEGKLVPYTRAEIIYHLSQTHQAATFIKPTENALCPYVVVDVNVDIFWGESDIKISMDEFIASTHQETICGQQVNVLDPMEEFIALCLHHYKHLNSIYLLLDEGVHLNLLCDIYEYLKRNQIDPVQLRTRCKHWQALPYVYFCVFYADALFTGDVLKTYLDTLYCEEGQILLNCIGLKDAERRVPSANFWDRMFCNDMKTLLAEDLTLKDWDVLETNKRYMKRAY